jgi:hypothetical protein
MQISDFYGIVKITEVIFLEASHALGHRYFIGF